MARKKSWSLLANQKTDIKAKVVGTDSKTDLAVLKLESTKGLPEPAEWADSDKVEVGDWSVAIGSPFALGQSVTVGIVSAKGNRSSLALTGAEYGGDLLQTDAAINPGNSGGPLCDLNGHVMGVNTAIYTRSGGYMGIGFAIPSNLAKDITGKLIKDGKVIRRMVGRLHPASRRRIAQARWNFGWRGSARGHGRKPGRQSWYQSGRYSHRNYRRQNQEPRPQRQSVADSGQRH
jgi:S1-C subfamily serine protease